MSQETNTNAVVTMTSLYSKLANALIDHKISPFRNATATIQRKLRVCPIITTFTIVGLYFMDEWQHGAIMTILKIAITPL